MSPEEKALKDIINIWIEVVIKNKEGVSVSRRKIYHYEKMREYRSKNKK